MCEYQTLVVLRTRQLTKKVEHVEIIAFFYHIEPYGPSYMNLKIHAAADQAMSDAHLSLSNSSCKIFKHFDAI